MAAKEKNILLKENILKNKNKTYKTFVEYISEDFRTIKANTPHEYIKLCWDRYKKCPVRGNTQQRQALNGKMFEVIVETCLYREKILPMYLQANVTFVPNVDFDVILFNGDKRAPIAISLKTSLRERYKQADLEAIALKYVHRNAENYLIGLSSDEIESVKGKLNSGDLLGLNHIIAADLEEFDEFINEMKSINLICPEKVDIVKGEIIHKRDEN